MSAQPEGLLALPDRLLPARGLCTDQLLQIGHAATLTHAVTSFNLFSASFRHSSIALRPDVLATFSFSTSRRNTTISFWACRSLDSPLACSAAMALCISWGKTTCVKWEMCRWPSSFARRSSAMRTLRVCTRGWASRLERRLLIAEFSPPR